MIELENKNYTPKDLWNSVNLCTIIYDVDDSDDWVVYDKCYLGDLHTVSVHLDRNLIGKVGTIQIGYHKSDDTLYLVYSGTQDAEFWLYNADTHIREYDGIRFHEGLLKLSIETAMVLLKDKSIFDGVNRVVHCGHSAGGAVAGIVPNMVAKEINVEEQIVIDFGTPRYISEMGKDFVYPFYRLRFQEIYDLIPCVPLTWRGPLPGFQHFGSPIFTTPKHKLIKKLPWYRPAFFGLKYLRSLYKRGPVTEVMAHHSVDNYAASVVTNCPIFECILF